MRSVAGIHRQCHGAHSCGIVQSGQQNGFNGFGRGQYLDGDLGQCGERSKGSGQQFGEVIAGDILHDPATALHKFTTPGHGFDTQNMIARGTRLDAARSGQIASNHAAQGSTRAAIKTRKSRRLEGQHLAFCGNCSLNLCQRRTRPCREHELFGFVERDPTQSR